MLIGDAEFTLTYPDGRQEVLLSVPKYDFNWQLTCELSKWAIQSNRAPLGTITGLANS